MRAVTFSNPEVAKLMNDTLVCAWTNKGPEQKYRDGMYEGGRTFQILTNGVGITNVTSVFAAPDGTVLHAVPGYLGVSSFKRHVDFARAMHARLFGKGVRRQDRAELYADAHRTAMKESRENQEIEAHELLAARYMRVGDLPFKFFDGMAREDG